LTGALADGISIKRGVPVRYFANLVIHYLQESIGNCNDSVICIVCRISVFDKVQNVFYAIRIGDRMLVGKFIAQIFGSIFSGRKLIVRNNQVLEKQINNIDVQPLFVSGENFADIVLESHSLASYDTSHLTDVGTDWICRANNQSVEYFSPNRCRRDFRLTKFVRSFSTTVIGLLQGVGSQNPDATKNESQK
jgi:hypothetical protein